MNITEKILSVLLILVSVSCIYAQKSAGSKLKQVKVYFHFIGSEGIESKVIPLKRRVSRKAPLFPTLETMLVEPTEAEQKLGYYSAGYGDMKLVSVKLKRSVARIDFSRPIRDDYNPGDLQTLTFESAVIKTAKQFPGIKKVIVCVNGINEFGIGLVEDAPRPCLANK